MLEIKNISKCYGKQQVLKDISFTCEKGIYALLGPNGAGKSTLMKIITTNLKADTGTILWNNQNIYENSSAYRNILSYMPQQQGLYHGFSGRMFLNYIAALKNIDRQRAKQMIDEAIKAVNLGDDIHRKIHTYSGGMKQRLLIASAVIGDPKLMIFDEPTAGLDPKERIRVKMLLQKLAKDRIILIATHIVPDVENIAEAILVLKDGSLLPQQTAEQLLAHYAPGGTLEDACMHIFSDGEEL